MRWAARVLNALAAFRGGCLLLAHIDVLLPQGSILSVSFHQQESGKILQKYNTPSCKISDVVQAAAKYFSQELGISDVRAGLTPEVTPVRVSSCTGVTGMAAVPVGLSFEVTSCF